MKTMIKKAAEGILFFVSVTVLVLCVTATVSGQNGMKDDEKERYYKEKEKVLLADTRALLDDLGFQNSGVTITKITDGTGVREYVFTIHHYRLDDLEEPKRKETIGMLTEKLAVLAEEFWPASPEDEIGFDYKFLIL